MWTAQGCYNDNNINANPGTSRILPFSLGDVTSVEQCESLALSNNYNVIGLQAGGQCYAGTNLDYSAAGEAMSCGTLGGDWSNNVYTYTGYTKPV
jgi:hypothetical protein